MLKAKALNNIENSLKGNPYPGRGIIIGKNSIGEWIQVYWIMGRSENSRNRIFVMDNGILKTQAADPSKVSDPSLIIYNAMRKAGNCYIVSNGVQTDTIYDGVVEGSGFSKALLTHKHEPDAPNFTPRISGCIYLDTPQSSVWFSVIKSDLFNKEISQHQSFRYMDIAEGFGYAVTTYKSDGNPIPSFEGTPYLVPLDGSKEDIAEYYWDILDESNKISIAVRSINAKSLESDTFIINKNTPV